MVCDHKRKEGRGSLKKKKSKGSQRGEDLLNKEADIEKAKQESEKEVKEENEEGVKMREPGSPRRQRKRVSDGLYHHSPKLSILNRY